MASPPQELQREVDRLRRENEELKRKPLSFKEKLVQNVGRILRTYEGKENAVVYDYVDKQVPVLNRMFFRRAKAYETMQFA